MFFACPISLTVMILSFTGFYLIRLLTVALDKNTGTPLCPDLSLSEHIICPPQLILKCPYPAHRCSDIPRISHLFSFISVIKVFSLPLDILLTFQVPILYFLFSHVFPFFLSSAHSDFLPSSAGLILPSASGSSSIQIGEPPSLGVSPLSLMMIFLVFAFISKFLWHFYLG